MILLQHACHFDCPPPFPFCYKVIVCALEVLDMMMMMILLRLLHLINRVSVCWLLQPQNHLPLISRFLNTVGSIPSAQVYYAERLHYFMYLHFYQRILPGL